MHYVETRHLKIPALGFGTWQLTGEKCVNGVKTALDIGYRHIDTAQIYENEAQVGQAIAESPISREEIFLTTKIWISHFRKQDVLDSFEESLKKLKTEYVDLLLIHWPNPEVELDETLGAMKMLQEQGKVKAIGVSNFPVALMRQAGEELGYDIACNQVEYHALLKQDIILDYAVKNEMAITAYSPLARGKLGENDVLARIAAKHGKSAGQIALRWLIQQKNVTAIPKASSKNHIRQNFEIFDFELDQHDIIEINALRGNHRMVNPDFAPQWDKAD